MKRRRTWVAGILAVVYPGLGHLYAGRPGPAAFFAFAPLVLWVSLILFGAFNPNALFACTIIGLALYAILWITQVTWAVTLARRAGETYQLTRYNRFLVYVGFVISSAIATNVVARPIRQWLVEPFRLPSFSMAPTLLPGDQVFVAKAGPAAQWKRGDLVVYPVPEAPGNTQDVEPRMFLKRVIGVEGDDIEIHERDVKVNGSPSEHRACPAPEYAYRDQGVEIKAECIVERTAEGKSYEVIYQPEFDSIRPTYGPITLGAKQVFVMGDNRDNSSDSRFTGPIDADTVIGRAIVIWLSYSPTDGIRWDRMGTRL